MWVNTTLLYLVCLLLVSPLACDTPETLKQAGVQQEGTRK